MRKDLSEKAKRKLKSVSEILGDGQFYPDLPKVPFSECLNKTLVLLDAKIIKDFNGQFGKHDAGLMLFEEVKPDAAPEAVSTQESGILEVHPSIKFTTINSGQVVVERLQRLLTLKALPCEVTPTYEGGVYYNLK